MVRDWYAIGALNKAVERTNNLLFRRLNARLWLKIALVVLLIGGGFNPGNMTWREDNGNFEFREHLPLLAVIFAIALVIGLVLSFVRAVCQFIFIEALTVSEIMLLKSFKDNLDCGFNLFLFNLALGFATAIALALVIAPMVYLLVSDSGLHAVAVFLVLVLAVGIALSVLLAAGLAGSFTNDFVTVIMLKEGKGVVDGWRRLAGLIKDKTGEFGVYVLVRIAAGIAAAVILFVVELVVLVVAIVVAVLPAIGLGVVALGSSLAMGAGSRLLLLLLIPAVFIAIAYFMLVSYLIVVLTLPIPVFFRYHSMLFLERVEPALGFAVDNIRKEKTGAGKKIAVEPADAGRKLKVY